MNKKHKRIDIIGNFAFRKDALDDQTIKTRNIFFVQDGRHSMNCSEKT